MRNLFSGHSNNKIMILREKDYKRLVDIFGSVQEPIEVWAYGSRVTGKAHAGSDLDLVIRTESLQKLPFSIFAKLKETLRECNIPIVIELFDWARLPENFQNRIEANYEVLFPVVSIVLNEPNEEYKTKNLKD